MKNNTAKVLCLVAMCMLLAGALAPTTAAATTELQSSHTTDNAASCVTIYPNQPGVNLDVEGCKDLIPVAGDGS